MSDKTNYLELANSLGEIREILSAMVAGFRADGFTEEQARDITVSLFKLNGRSDDA